MAAQPTAMAEANAALHVSEDGKDQAHEATR